MAVRREETDADVDKLYLFVNLIRINDEKIFFATILMLLSFSAAKAQSIFDISGLNTPRLNGTARYMGMAGSFGALGGDASAILDNRCSWYISQQRAEFLHRYTQFDNKYPVGNECTS